MKLIYKIPFYIVLFLKVSSAKGSTPAETRPLLPSSPPQVSSTTPVTPPLAPGLTEEQNRRLGRINRFCFTTEHGQAIPQVRIGEACTDGGCVRRSRMERVFSEGRSGKSSPQGRTMLNYVSARFQAFLSSAPSTTRFQIACLAGCAARALVRFSGCPIKTAFSPAETVVAAGRGTCVDLSRVTAEIATAQGLTMDIVDTAGSTRDSDESTSRATVSVCSSSSSPGLLCGIGHYVTRFEAEGHQYKFDAMDDYVTDTRTCTMHEMPATPPTVAH